MAGRVAFRANQFFWTSDQSYNIYALGLVRAARSLGLTDTEIGTVRRSLQATGLLGPPIPIRVTITPAGAGTVIATQVDRAGGPAIVLTQGEADEGVILTAKASSGRRFVEYLLTIPPATPGGMTLTANRTDPETPVVLQQGIVIEARFE